MSSPATEPSLPPAAENAVRAYASQLRAIADFELAAIHLLGAEVRLYSDRVLHKPHVSPDLVTAQPV
ncbi:MAG: hypothetical protein ACRD0H_06035 [Actinomycetes bacterium]